MSDAGLISGWIAGFRRLRGTRHQSIVRAASPCYIGGTKGESWTMLTGRRIKTMLWRRCASWSQRSTGAFLTSNGWVK